MSEQATEEAPPLNPILEAIDAKSATETPATEAVEETTEETGEETVEESPKWSKPLQKLQQENANLRKDIASIKGLLEKGFAAKTPEAKQDKLAKVRELLKGEQGEDMERFMPGLRGIMADLADEVAETRQGATESATQRQKADAFEDYMSDKPAGFREAYSEKQAELQAELEAEGEEVDEFAMRIAMKDWAKGYLKTAKTPAATPAPSGKSVIPVTGARRASNAHTPEALTKQLQSGVGGNLLGVKPSYQK